MATDDYGNNASTAAFLAVGGQVSGAIELPGDTDWFKVWLHAGTIYLFDLKGADSGGGTLGAGPAEARLSLYDPNGSFEASVTNGGLGGDPEMSFTPAFSNYYYLAASDLYDTSTGTYQISAVALSASADDYANNRSTTGLVTVGEQVAGNIELPNDEDWFKIWLDAGTIYRFDLKGADSGSGTFGAGSTEPLLYLYDEYWSFDEVPIGGGIGGDPEMYFTPLISGYYYLGVSDRNREGTGTYQITADALSPSADDYADNTSTTGLLEVGGQVSGDVELPRDEDWFKIWLDAGTIYLFDLRGADSGGGTLGSGSAEANLSLYDATGSLQDSAVNGGSGGDPGMSFTPVTGGFYYLSASDLYKSGTGTYQISAVALAPSADDYGNNTSTTGSLTIGGQVMGSIELPNDQDWFEVWLDAGMGYSFELKGDDGGGGTPDSGLAEARLALFGDPYEYPSAFTNTVELGDALQLFYIPKTSGYYYVAVSELFDSGTGTYALTANQVDGTPPTLSIVSADYVQSEGDAGETNYIFTVTRVGDTSGASSIDWAVGGVGGYPPPVTGDDFVSGVLPSGSLSFLAEESSKEISIAVAGDTTAEQNEWFTVVLSNPSGARLGRSSDHATILNDDVAIGQFFVGTPGDDRMSGALGDDTLDGLEGYDTIQYPAIVSSYSVSKGDGGYYVDNHWWADDTDFLINIENVQFLNVSVNLVVQGKAAATPEADVDRLIELYVAFFNRMPDADGLDYWLDQRNSGQTIDQIAQSFYDAGVQYSSLTGFSASMSDADFVNVVYRNVLGRQEGADADGLAYWTGELASGRTSPGTLVSTILDSAHTFKGDPTWGWVADLLDNKIVVARQVAIDWGLTYNTPEDSISYGMATAAAVTPTGINDALSAIGAFVWWNPPIDLS